MIAVALASSVAESQTPRRVTLGAPSATLAAEFSQIANMRELSDGRVLVTDFIEQSITVGDFRTNAVKKIGQRGEGPGEYPLVTQLFPLGGDTTLMPLESAMRWTVISPDFKFSTLPADAPMVKLVGSDRVVGTDAMGHVLTHAFPHRGPGIMRDTSVLLLGSMRTGKVDTISRTDGGPAPQRGQRGDQITAYTNYDQSVMAVDGWVVIVRRDPYRAEWRSPTTGRWTIGKPVGDAPTPLTSAEKKAYMDRRAAAQASASTKRVSAPGVATKQGAAPDFEILFPESIPPAAVGPPPLISPLGFLLVRRNLTAAQSTPLYDVFDRQGNRLYQLSVSSNQRPIAFGASSLYVVNTDDDGIQRISRHPWPVRP